MMKESPDNAVGALPNRELVVYALFLLGGDTNRVHTEDVALKCFELCPQSFSWVKHAEYPDKDIVRVALTDARKEHYGALVEGRAGQRHGLTAKTKRGPVPDGWILTATGSTRCDTPNGEPSEPPGAAVIRWRPLPATSRTER